MKEGTIKHIKHKDIFNSDLPFAVRMTIDETAEYPRMLWALSSTM